MQLAAFGEDGKDGAAHSARLHPRKIEMAIGATGDDLGMIGTRQRIVVAVEDRLHARQTTGESAQVRCSRCAIAAAWVRLCTPSLLRIRDTWTLAVFSAMNSAAPICRFVAPSAISVRT